MHRYLGRRFDNGGSDTVNEDEQRWDVVLAQYGWGTPDSLDEALKKFIDTSILDVDDIEANARIVDEAKSRMSKMGSFENSWKPFHDSFSENEEDVCRAIAEGIRENFPMVSRANLDAAVSVLRRVGRDTEAESLIDFADVHADESFWLADAPFKRQIDDKRIRELAERRREAAKPVFDFETDLLAAAQNLRSDKAALAATPVERYQSLFEDRTGSERDQYIFAALEYRKIVNASDDERLIVSKAEEALRRIAQESKLNEIRIGKFGVSLQHSNRTGDGLVPND